MITHFEDNVRKSLKERISEYIDKETEKQTKEMFGGHCKYYENYVFCLRNIDNLKRIKKAIFKIFVSNKHNFRKSLLSLCDTYSNTNKDLFFNGKIKNYEQYIVVTNELRYLANIKDIAKGEAADKLEDDEMSFYDFTVLFKG